VTDEENRLAAAIDQRVRQLEAAGIAGDALLEHMVGNILNLHRLWSTTSDESLVALFRRYPGLYRYGMLMEAAEVERKKTKTSYGHLPELPDSVKPIVAGLLTDGAMLERQLQALLDGFGRHGAHIETEIREVYPQWMTMQTGLPSKLQSAQVPEESCTFLVGVFDAMAQRINRLHGQIIT
jgi:hypothetical protein